MTGDNVNDIIGVGDFTNTIHYNGNIVIKLDEIENLVPAFRYMVVDFKSRITVIVYDTPNVIQGYKIE